MLQLTGRALRLRPNALVQSRQQAPLLQVNCGGRHRATTLQLQPCPEQVCDLGGASPPLLAQPDSICGSQRLTDVK